MKTIIFVAQQERALKSPDSEEASSILAEDEQKSVALDFCESFLFATRLLTCVWETLAVG